MACTGLGLHQANQTLRRHRTRIDANHTDTVGRTGAAKRAREGHQRSVASGAGDVAGVESFAAVANDVDDDAAVARLHLSIETARQIDIAKQLEVEGGAPAVFFDIKQAATRCGTGIVDENVDVRAQGCQLFGSPPFSQVNGMNPHLDTVTLTQFLACALQVVG